MLTGSVQCYLLKAKPRANTLTSRVAESEEIKVNNPKEQCYPTEIIQRGTDPGQPGKNTEQSKTTHEMGQSNKQATMTGWVLNRNTKHTYTRH